jgi:hypothetical protein
MDQQPAVERLAVEERNKTLLGGGDRGGDGERQADDYNAGGSRQLQF